MELNQQDLQNLIILARTGAKTIDAPANQMVGVYQLIEKLESILTSQGTKPESIPEQGSEEKNN